jgi:hypothetical protein
MAMRLMANIFYLLSPSHCKIGRGVTHARTTGRRGRGAVRAIRSSRQPPSVSGGPAGPSAISASNAAHPNRS